MRAMKQKIADVHCHVVPGVDDGAQTVEESLSILEQEYEQGVRMMILTPHWRRGMFETDRSTVEARFLELNGIAT